MRPPLARNRVLAPFRMAWSLFNLASGPFWPVRIAQCQKLLPL
jgi:hypothetical protein